MKYLERELTRLLSSRYYDTRDQRYRTDRPSTSRPLPYLSP
jgi:hypothetical protein